MTAKDFGYTRVSTLHQVDDRQKDQLAAAGIAPEDIYSDKISGMKFKRDNLDKMLAAAREGDTITVTSLDRLGRSMREIIITCHELHQRGVVLKTLKEGIDYSTAFGKMLTAIFGGLAEYERDLMLERVAETRAAAARRGKRIGKPVKLTDDQKRRIYRLHTAGERMPEIVKDYGVSVRTGYRAVAELAATP